MIERLAQGGRDKLKEDGLNFSDWLQSLASFWGSLLVIFSSLHEFDIHPQGELEFQCTCAKQK